MSKALFGDDYVEYALGSLEPERAEPLTAHLAQCAECRAELRELEEVLHSLPTALPQTPPPPHLLEKIREEIRSESPPAPSAKSNQSASGVRLWAMAASVLALLGLGTSIVLYQQGLDARQLVASLQREVANLRNLNQDLNLKVAELTDPGLRHVRLAGQAGFEAAQGSAFIRPDSLKTTLFLHDLPQLAADRQFQLWILEGGVPPHPSQVFDSAGAVTEIDLDLPLALDRVVALAISIEPQGGSLSPSQQIILVGSL